MKLLFRVQPGDGRAGSQEAGIWESLNKSNYKSLSLREGLNLEMSRSKERKPSSLNISFVGLRPVLSCSLLSVMGRRWRDSAVYKWG